VTGASVRRVDGDGRHARLRAPALARASAAMLDADRSATVADVVLAEARAVTGAVAGGFAVIDSAGMFAILSSFGYPADFIAQFDRLTTAEPNALSEAIQTGAPLVIEDSDAYAARFPHLAGAFRTAGHEAAVVIPLKAHGRNIGGFTLGFADRDRGSEEVGFLEALGATAAASIERLRAVEAERRGKDEAEALARVARALMDAETLGEVGELAWSEAAVLLKAPRGAFYLLDSATDEVVLVGRPQLSDTLQAQMNRIPMSRPVAATDVIRTGEPIVLEDPEGYSTRYPQTTADLFAPTKPDFVPGATLVVPVRAHGCAIGSLGFAFEKSRRFSERDVWLAQSFADAAASATERLRHLEAEQAARRRATTLARASTAMLEANDPAAVGEIVVGEAREVTGAVTAGFSILDPLDGALVRVAAFGYSTRIVAEYARRAATGGTPIGEVVQTGTSLVIDGADSYAARFPDLAEVWREAGHQALVAVPLTAHGETIGGFSLGFAEPGRRGADEMAFLETLGATAAAAIERLRALEAERRRKEEAEALARVTRALMDAETLEQVGDLAWREAAALLGAQRGVLYLVDRAADELVLIGRPGFSDEVRSGYGRIPLSAPLIATDVVRLGEPIAVESVAGYAARYPQMVNAFGSELPDEVPAASIVAPVRARGTVIGTLGFSFSEERHFSERDVWLAASFADAAASAAERLRHLAADEEARRRATALARASGAMLDAAEPSAVGQIVLEEARAVTGAVTGSFAVLDRNTESIVVLASLGYAADDIARFARIPAASETAIAEVLRTGVPIELDSVEAYVDRFPTAAEAFRHAGHRAFIAVPLTAHGETIGGFSLGFAERASPGGDNRGFLQALGAAAAAAIEQLRAHRLLEAVVSQMPVGVTVSDAGGRFLAMNARVREVWHGAAAAESIADYQQWHGFHSDGRPYEPEDWPMARSLQHGEVVLDEEIEIERFDGSRATIVNSSAPVRDEQGSILAGVVILSDITGRVEAERAREAFLAVLSHELRTPITSIFMAAKLLRDRGETLEAATRRDLYLDIDAEAQRMNRVVENLLVLSRVERGIQLATDEPVLLKHLLRDIVVAEARLWPKVSFRLQCPNGLPVVLGEPGCIEQVMRNLLSNAAKYAGGEVLVDVSVGAADREVLIRVSDAGPGIPEADRLRVFELFYRIPGSQSSMGAGIGLFVVRNLVEAMGGRIRVEPSSACGACFSVSLRQVPRDAS
jgi:PAS domain S-box-containing protein